MIYPSCCQWFKKYRKCCILTHLVVKFIKIFVDKHCHSLHSLFKVPRWSGLLNWESANVKKEPGSPFRVPFTFASSPLSESLEQATHSIMWGAQFLQNWSYRRPLSNKRLLFTPFLSLYKKPLSKKHPLPRAIPNKRPAWQLHQNHLGNSEIR